MSVDDSDLRTCLRELVTILASCDDEEELKKSSQCCHTAVDLQRKNNLETQRNVEELAKKREDETKLLMSCLQEDKENEDNISSLENRRENVVSSIENLSNEVASVEEGIKQTEMAASKMREEKADIQHETVKVLPKTKYAFSLYSNITRIRWDYESEPDQLKGFAASLRDVRPFTLNTKDNSPYFTANYLWDVIASS